ncbi:MAG: hypothetical protein Q9180_009250, partial [Flavoplaca navasiana]
CYTFPSRLQYIASSDDINDTAITMRVGQICTFLPAKSPSGESCWLGITISQIFASQWGGMSSPSIINHEIQDPTGHVAYEVEVKQPVKSDCTTDRDEVRPTGRKVGTVLGAGPGRLCYVKIEDWFTASDMFRTRGTWRSMGGQVAVREPAFVERADGSIAVAYRAS